MLGLATVALAGVGGEPVPSPVVSGGLRAEQVEAVIEPRTPSIRACYAGAMARRPPAPAWIELRSSIDGGGQVTVASVASSPFVDAGADRCAAEIVGSLVFPAPEEGEARVRYPLRLPPPPARFVWISGAWAPDRGEGTGSATMLVTAEAGGARSVTLATADGRTVGLSFAADGALLGPADADPAVAASVRGDLVALGWLPSERAPEPAPAPGHVPGER